MEMRVIGIDLGKSVFHLVGMDEHGKVVARKRLSRSQLMVYRNVLVVAVANKLARIAWAVLARGDVYHSAPVCTTG
jgi:hypothetical protein